MIEVIPAILEKSFAEIESKIHMVEQYVTWIQIDIADDTLVNNRTYLNGKSFASLTTHAKLEAHMMVRDPIKYIPSFIEGGFKRFFGHVEGEKVDEFILKCQESGVEVGLAIDGPTPIEKIFPYLSDIDAVLVMAIEAGESGRPFREETIEKIKAIGDKDFEMPIAIDGAMNQENARKVVSAGATRINSNSYIFGSGKVEERIRILRNLDENN